MKFKLIAVLLFCFVLISCNKTNVDPKQNQPTNTVQSMEATIVPTIASTVEPSPTATIVPTVASTVEPSPTATIVPPTTTPELSTEAYTYLEEALNIMEENSIDKYNVDWDGFRSKVMQLADGASTPADTYPAIRFALGKLGAGHSFFMNPSQVNELKDGSFFGREDREPSGKIIDEKFGYILLPGFVGMDDVANDFATEIQKIIQEIDQEKPCAWIVDLQKNRGGNMWPMLAGIGPILGEGCHGSFIDPDGEEVQWCYKDGVAYEGDEIAAKVNGVAYETVETGLPVAVLTASYTGSSGEAIVVAFRGQPNTQSFGFRTAGFPTANESFEMSDGAWLVVTGAAFADRTGQVYEGKIAPDVIVKLPGEFPREVEKWFLEQPSCKTDE